jgi:glycerol-3-phosphate dehydrogenase
MTSGGAGCAPTYGLSAVASASLDLLVVGGGVTGACIALEAARRGLAVGLVERGDFGGGATANCLKIVHGGLRYLQHLDVRRVLASAAERSVWLRSAPHLVEPLPVLLPTYRGRFPSRPALAAALAVNELLSLHRNRGLLPERWIPRAQVLSRRECLALEPLVDTPELTGGVLFHDALMYSPERLTLEVVQAAQAAGAAAANHVEFVAPVIAAGRVSGARIRDVLTGEVATVRTRWIVNATGSSVPALAAGFAPRAAVAQQAYSVALSFVTRQPARNVAFSLPARQTPAAPRAVGGRQLFVVPWRGQTMIGTAHLQYRGDPAAFILDRADVEHFAREIATATPTLPLAAGDVVVVHSGLMPVSDSAPDRGVRLLKRHRIVDHAADGCHGALSVVTVKFTTAGQVAREVVDRLARTERAPGSPGPRMLPLPGGAFPSLARLHARAREHYGQLLADDILEHLVRTYGAMYEAVLERRRHVRAWDERVVPGAPVIRAQLVHGVLAEQARTAADLLWRRTEIGPRGLVTGAAQRMADEAIGAALHGGGSQPAFLPE